MHDEYSKEMSGESKLVPRCYVTVALLVTTLCILKFPDKLVLGSVLGVVSHPFKG